MAQEVTCPTCGGIIFSDDAEAMELSPCTCGTVSAGAPAPSSHMSASESSRSSLTSISSDDEPSIHSFEHVPPARPSAEAEAASRKLCVNCGKDVTGRKRFKDSSGQYWCPDCEKKDMKRKRVEKKREEETKTVCGLCGTSVAVQNLLAYDNRFICPKCYKEQKELEKKTEARIGRINNAFEGQDWKRLIPMLAILGLCALIILLRWLKIIGT
jgi:predicted RNA-binding Zn-ribbon protein involved in translation (DUF1610 family)